MEHTFPLPGRQLPTSPLPLGHAVQVWEYWLSPLLLERGAEQGWLPGETGTWEPAWQRILSLEEQDRLARLRTLPMRQRFAAARLVCRLLLASELQVSPEEVQFTMGPHGKPEVLQAQTANSGNDVAFNLSHSQDLLVIALGRNVSLGVDVEFAREAVHRIQIGRRFFSAAEASFLEQLPEAEQLNAFYRIWTRKEAVLKGDGSGLSQGMAEPCVLPPSGEVVAWPRQEVVFQGVSWSLEELQLGPGYWGALAISRRLCI